MAYTHLTMDELIWIEKYWKNKTTPAEISRILNRARQTIYNVVNWLKKGLSIQAYYARYKDNKRQCGAKKIQLSSEDTAYIQEKVSQGWTPDVIIGRQERPLPLSMRTLYRRFRDSSDLMVETLPMKGKRKPNGYREKRGKQQFRRNLKDREAAYHHYDKEFGHLEGDTIIGKDHQSAIITLVERLSKVIITLKPQGRTAHAIEERLHDWLTHCPSHLFKSITFDCGKEFSNWKTISNQHDIDIFFADPGCPSQRGLNEHSNALLRRGGLTKGIDFNELSEMTIQSVSEHRNHIPRKSLGYKTPMEVLLEQASQLSSLI